VETCSALAIRPQPDNKPKCKNHFAPRLVQSSWQLLSGGTSNSLFKQLDHLMDLTLATALRQTSVLTQANSDIVRTLDAVIVRVKKMPTDMCVFEKLSPFVLAWPLVHTSSALVPLRLGTENAKAVATRYHNLSRSIGFSYRESGIDLA
jgi:hypothetical protein